MKPGCSFNDGTGPGEKPCGLPSIRFFSRSLPSMATWIRATSRCGEHGDRIRVSEFCKEISYEEFLILQVLEG